MRGRQPFSGRTAVVTGAASGIGRALAAQLAAAGADVVLTDLDGDAVRRAGARITEATGTRTDSHPLDVRDRDAFAACIGEVISDHGAVDLLFNNAGVSLGGHTHDLSGAHWDHVIDVNLRGVVNGTLATYPHMVRRRTGHIVNTASGAGLVAPPYVTAYATTKHAVVGLSTGLRPEAALHGVRVSVLCPGAIDTPILDALPDADLPPLSTRPVTARQYLRAIGQTPIPPEQFARQALAAIARNRSIIVVPRRAAALWYLHRASPALAGNLTHALARRVERQLLSSPHPDRRDDPPPPTTR